MNQLVLRNFAWNIAGNKTLFNYYFSIKVSQMLLVSFALGAMV